LYTSRIVFLPCWCSCDDQWVCIRQKRSVVHDAGKQAAHAREKGASFFLGTHELNLSEPHHRRLPIVIGSASKE
jgi:hypothetical protein